MKKDREERVKRRGGSRMEKQEGEAGAGSWRGKQEVEAAPRCTRKKQ